MVDDKTCESEVFPNADITPVESIIQSFLNYNWILNLLEYDESFMDRQSDIYEDFTEFTVTNYL